VDTGSSFLPSEIIAAFLWAQIENLEAIQQKRIQLWNAYFEGIKDVNQSSILLPKVPNYATNNGHMFYINLENIQQRDVLIQLLKENGYQSVFHYISLHSSTYYLDKHDGRELPNSDTFTNTLLRLPMYYELEFKDIETIVATIRKFQQL
jgi:dTDP-4-amino-4,6-dideoxygalactose transaminase